MKHLVFLLTLLTTLPAFASPQRDALLGIYAGDGCHLSVVEAQRQGETDLIFTDSMGGRTLWNVGRALEAQLARGANPLVFDHTRESLGDMTIHLEIALGADGKPASMRGTGWGWGGNTTVRCTFSN